MADVKSAADPDAEESAFVAAQLPHRAEDRSRARDGVSEHGFPAKRQPRVRYPIRSVAVGGLSERGAHGGKGV